LNKREFNSKIKALAYKQEDGKLAQKKKPVRKIEKKIKPVKKAEKYVLTEKEKKIRNEIRLLISLAITLLLELSCFGFLSPIGDYLGYFIFGCFGFVGYIIPVLVFLLIAFIISNGKNRNAIRKSIAGVLFVLLFISMIQLIFYGYHIGKSAFYYYEISATTKLGGGFFGALISNLLSSVIGIVGSYIVLLILIIICLIVITEKSFVDGVKEKSKKVYNTAYEYKEAVKEKDREKDREKVRRVNKKVKGVSITRIEKPDKQNEDVHEITDVFIEEDKVTDEVFRGHVEPIAETYEDEREYSEGISYEKEEIETDEEGFFKPKEKIEVSKEAVSIMQRPAYSYQKVEKTSEEISSQTSAVQRTKEKRNIKYTLPRTNLLNKGVKSTFNNEALLKQTAINLKSILKNFSVNAEVTDYSRGPSVTRYEIQPETGTRLSKITSLADDIKLNLAATDIRIEPIPGKSTIGIEVPNEKRESVFIRDLIESKELMNHPSKLAFAAGMDIAGKVIIGDIAKMPHMLVAGTTGSGKSVFTNSIIMSILFRAKPEEVRLIIVDPKVVEFGVYNGIPHLLQPVVTDPRLASNTLKWAVAEMSDRYKKFAEINVRDLKGYNEKIKNQEVTEDGEIKKTLPQIVIVIDELADLMMVAAKEVEESICRLAQLARAAGIHLVIATQRPSVDVVTGLIKANIPSRVALMVSSGVDSRTIIDSNGAEKLLGNGDMLFYPSGYPKAVRLQGAFVSDEEVSRVVEFLVSQVKEPVYDDSIIEYVKNQSLEKENQAVDKDDEDYRDEYFFDAARFVVEKEKASTSMLQRVFKIGFNRAARIIEQLEQAGIIGAEEGTKPRKVLISKEELETYLNT